jgi:hypothetical protein
MGKERKREREEGDEMRDKKHTCREKGMFERGKGECGVL